MNTTKNEFKITSSTSTSWRFQDTAFSTSFFKASTVSTQSSSPFLAERKCTDFEENMFQRHWESFWSKAFKRALADFSESKFTIKKCCRLLWLFNAAQLVPVHLEGNPLLGSVWRDAWLLRSHLGVRCEKRLKASFALKISQSRGRKFNSL